MNENSNHVGDGHRAVPAVGFSICAGGTANTKSCFCPVMGQKHGDGTEAVPYKNP